MQLISFLMIVSSTSLILITVLLLIIRTMPSRQGVGWWTCAASLQSFAYILQMLFHDDGKTVSNMLIFYLLQTTVNHLLVIGTLLFIKQKLDLRLWLAVPTVMLAVTTALSLSGQTFLGALLFAVENASAFFMVAYAIYKTAEPINKSTKMMGVFSFLVGVHWLDFPFLGHLEWFQAIGFIIGMTLAIGIFMSLSAMALLQFRDHTQRSEKRAIYAAGHDPLTGLYNRSSLDGLFDDYVAEADEKKLSFIVMYLDLDGFKAVNDQYGHKAGDMLLITVAKRLEKWLGDKGDAIRIGGDEIIVLTRLRGAYSEESAYKSARLLLDMIELPIVDGDNVHNISSSIGGCSYLPGIITPSLDDMIQCADKQMYKAKQAGGHCIFFKEQPGAKRKLIKPDLLVIPKVAEKLQRKKRTKQPIEVV
ncbi:hypothetical protein DKW60_09245 [Leucothrix pacifica]|uniref:GGDEF domain-containing protein n=2 Tax=Leucothrix pacifica TaxID=1247513 RepID=A0A317CK80_9GAMM|nr:hypothetical protein DKW60_09245 [Leucothrix pacifica]